jgi:hypothetical protein
VSPEELMERNTNQYGRAYCELERVTNFTRRAVISCFERLGPHLREPRGAPDSRVSPDESRRHGKELVSTSARLDEETPVNYGDCVSKWPKFGGLPHNGPHLIRI